MWKARFPYLTGFGSRRIEARQTLSPPPAMIERSIDYRKRTLTIGLYRLVSYARWNKSGKQSLPAKTPKRTSGRAETISRDMRAGNPRKRGKRNGNTPYILKARKASCQPCAVRVRTYGSLPRGRAEKEKKHYVKDE